MILTHDILKDITMGATSIQNTDKGYVFERFTKAESDIYLNTVLEQSCENPAGVQLRFKTDASNISIEPEAYESVRGYFALEVFANDKKIELGLASFVTASQKSKTKYTVI